MSDPVTLDKRISVFLAVKKAERPARRAAFSLALPVLFFLIVSFVIPIFLLLITALGNPEPKQVLQRTMLELQGWDGTETPNEDVFAAFANDLKVAQENRTAALLAKRLNYEIPGMRSKIVRVARGIAAQDAGPWRDTILKLDPDLASPKFWLIVKRNALPITPYYILTALDLEWQPDGSVSKVEKDQAIFLIILQRTLLIAATVTLITLILGYPVAYMITVAPPLIGQIMILMVLLPLWTSLLVRTTAWVVLLQTDGVINDVLMMLGITNAKIQLIFTRFGTVTAMTHIQLPFTILPIYAVMRAIPQTQLRAARSLGASPLSAFWRVYAPQTLPGVVAGCLMTFILSLGYYITPALVGGPDDQMVSNFISTYINRDLNWGLAAALGVILLSVTLAIYAAFLRLVGADKIKFG